MSDQERKMIMILMKSRITDIICYIIKAPTVFIVDPNPNEILT